jgi:exodeoxyribonuclease V beta subunit
MKPTRFSLDTAPLDRGTVLLEASAGTGKTYTLVGLLLRLLLEGRIDRLEQALVVTFTIAATEELKTRLRSAIEQLLAVIGGAPCDEPLYRRLATLDGAEQRLRQALDDFDRAPIATIHGFCKRLLDESAFETRQPFRLDFVVDLLPLLHRAAADVLRRTYAPEPDRRHAVLALANLTPDTLVEQYRLWRRYPDVQLEPATPDAEPHLRALEASLRRAAELFDADCREAIAGLRFLAGRSPFAGELDAELDRFAAALHEQPLLALATVRRLAPSQLPDSLHKRPPPSPLPHPFFAACDEVAGVLPTATAHLRAQLLQELDALLARDKQRQHVLSFDDLLQRTHEALHDPDRKPVLLAAIRERYRVALIDEFQDTDALQYQIFATCFRGRSLFLIGDPKQSIYGFRGADLQAYLDASRDAEARETLDVNFRSSAPLVAAVSQLFAAANAFVEPRIRLPEVRAHAAAGELAIDGDPGPALRWRLLPVAMGKSGPLGMGKDQAEQRIADDTAAEIARLLAVGARIGPRPLQPRDCAVLTRSNKQAVRVQEALREAGIVSAIGKAGDIFETDEFVEVERLLRAILQPGNLGLARAAMATRLWGKDASWLVATLDDDDRFDTELRRLDEWRRRWHRHGFVVTTEQLQADLAVVPRLLAQRGGERSLTNFQQLFELLHQAEHGQRLSPEGLLEWLQHERRHRDQLDYQLRELRLESDEDAVQILTVHGSKGLQYEVVFAPFLWDAHRVKAPGIAPGAHGRQLAFELDEQQKGAIEVDRLAEDVRLCYVALTRARRRCYVHVGYLGKEAHRSALAWLLWPPAADVDLTVAPTAFDTWADLAKASFPQLPQRIATLCAASGGKMGHDVVPDAPRAMPLPPRPSAPLARARTPGPKVPYRALHSFTSLVAGAHGLDPAPDVADPAAREVEAPAAPGSGIFGFARGARAGQCLHALLERVDLDQLDGDAARSLVQDTLAAFGLDDAAAHPGTIDPIAAVQQNLRDLAAAQVHTGGPTLAALCRGDKAIEWKFTLPTPGSRLDGLAAAFAQHGSDLARRYATRLSQLPNRYVHGFLVGFVDLIATHGERHWIVDWKSNHLGDQAAGYGAERLATAMVDSDYVLQYHLYVLALHRQLRARLRDYDYERHQGGICYAFLRGARPGEPNGMLYDRVPLPLVEAMDRWAGGER